MKTVILCLFALLLVIVIQCAPEKPRRLTPLEQEKRLAENWATIGRSVPFGKVRTIHSEEDFNKVLVRSPRNYTLVLLFSPERECYECRRVEENFAIIADSYGQQIRIPENPLLNETLLFFVHIPVEKLYAMTLKLQIRTAPAILVVPEVKTTGFPHKPEQILYYTSSPNGMDLYTISQFLKERTGVEIAGFWKPLPWKYIGIGVVSCIGILPFIYLICRRPYSPWTWFYGCMLVYYLNMSGFVGNAVHDSAWFQYNLWTGYRTWIHPSLQRQFRIEGFSTGFLLVCVSFCFIGIADGLPKIKSPLIQRLVFFLLLVTMFVFANTWMNIYCQKNTLYPYKYYVDVRELFTWSSTTFRETVAKIFKY